MESNSGKPNVLLVDDDQALINTVRRQISRRTEAFACHAAYSVHQAKELVEKIHPEVIVLDLGLEPCSGPEEGLSLITELLKVEDCARILVLTGQSEGEWGVRCINAGAASFLEKPVDPDHLVALLNDAATVSRLMRKNKDNSDVLTSMAGFGLATRSEAMKRAIELINFAASTSQPVLLCGETGVGKGIVASVIHHASKRRDGPFLRSQPSFGSHDLIASELFGHTKGAFTGATEARIGLIEAANGGSLFLDEVDSLPQSTQVALLNVLQDKEFQKVGSHKTYRSDFRLIAATNTPFELLRDGSKLRFDFYQRIAQTVIHLPPLRNRRADIPSLAREFVRRLAEDDESGTVCDLAPESIAWLTGQPWPGNIRELQATVERGYAHAQYHEKRFITLTDLQAPLPPTTNNGVATLSEQLQLYELMIASTVFAQHQKNYAATARQLGIDHKRLRRILARGECAL